MRVHLKLFFNGALSLTVNTLILFPIWETVRLNTPTKKEIQVGILEKYPPEWKEETPAPNSSDGGGQAQQDSPKNEPQRTQPKSEKRGGNPIRTSPPKKETAPDMTEAENHKKT